MKTFAWAFAAVLVCGASLLAADQERTPSVPAGFTAPGYRLLTTKPYLPADFNQTIFDNIWQSWEEPLRSQAEAATPEQRRAMAYSRYGLTTTPGDTSGKPQQYVVDAQGNWTMTCLACHQGKVAGQAYPGVPNSLYALQTLTEDIRATKTRMKQPLSRMDMASVIFPLGTTNGSTNAVMFGVALMANRDKDLNVKPNIPPKMVHHDHDAPAWWNFKKKTHLYSDGFSAKNHRPLMQFMLVPENGPEQFHEWEDDFREVYAWLESLEPPAYPFEIDRSLARQGEQIFNQNCADCHGTYGPQGEYPNRIVSIEELGTDPVRLQSLSPAHREAYGQSWFGHYGEDGVVKDPGGYVAPPLDGIWASAPYFHNGSVPTLWHVMHPDQRPAVWTRSEDGYDREKVGLEITGYETMPEGIADRRERRKYFDTTKHGKSAAGHEFPNALDDAQKRAVLEYLKTL